MSSDIPEFVAKNVVKKFPPPKQPRLKISSWCIYNFCYNSIIAEKLENIKKLLGEIKWIIRSIMGVRCERVYEIDIEFLQEVMRTEIIKKPSEQEIVINLPEQTFNENVWIPIQRALVPSIKLKQYTPEIFNIFLYIYQNLILSELTIKRKTIENNYKYEISVLKNDNSFARKKEQLLKKMRIEQNSFKKNTIWNWVNGLYNYIINNDTPDYLKRLIWSLVLLRASSVNLSEKYLQYEKYLDETIRYEKNEYIEVISNFRKLKCECKTKEEFEEWSFILNGLINSLKCNHHGKNYIDIDESSRYILENILTHSLPNRPEKEEIQALINKITIESANMHRSMLLTYDKNLVADMIMFNVNGLSKYSNIVVDILKNIKTSEEIKEYLNKMQKTEDFFITLPLYSLNNILECKELVETYCSNDESKLLFASCFIEQRNINTKIFKFNKEYIIELGNSVKNNIKGQLKYRWMDALDTEHL